MVRKQVIQKLIVPFALIAATAFTVSVTGCKSEQAPSTPKKDSVAMGPQAVTSEPGPFGVVNTYNITSSDLDTAFRAKQNHPNNPEQAVRAMLNNPGPNFVLPQFANPKEVKQLDVNDSMATIEVIPTAGVIKANAYVKKYVRGADTIWMLWRFEHLPIKMNG